ncbi:HD-GYP domain-containing protein [Fredinandcohnia sp. QZ13]|uniref:HD-GYP domain-containing protein n=1 Tax=Fredinandcohnia sp. QZ13 TaxID=3073144 RepID=UPI00285335A5|nr:HD-GYP domain-containing protein [Fredinandcohnia sp. QZ13]MDR4887947.1 HD-GYP domain-containing protein [Fredinandcohnia sp. QZ13]
MQKMNKKSVFLYEEKRTVTWFSTLFFIILIGYDIFFYYIYPSYVPGMPSGFPSLFSYVMYIFLLLLLPILFINNRKNKQYLTKYYFFFTYTTLSFIGELIAYWDKPELFSSGNAVEVFLVLFSPIFVNKRFYWTVVIGLIFKYLLLGGILANTLVAFPIVLTTVLAIIAYIILNRFQSYITALSTSYDQQMEGIVKGVIAALELKDPYTRGHSERVAKYAMVLAKELGVFANDELKSFNYACLLHDIGKVNIPDSILMKPAKLTNEEYEVIKTHPVVGEEAVKNVEGLGSSLSIIRSHHERWDGKGYPDQLKCEDIPLNARVVAIADAFDAMTSSRSYRGALPVEEAYNRIVQGQGTQFDPNLVELFKKVYPQWIDIQKES